MSSQTTRLLKLNSYWVMNSLGDIPVHTAALSDPVIKKNILYFLFKIHFLRNKYRIEFTKKPAVCLKSYFITNIKCYYKLHLH